MNVTRTTLALPEDLLAAVDQAVRTGKARSRNEFVAHALQRELWALENAAIDADLAGMANDSDYLTEAQRIADEFAVADWEAFQAGEAQSRAHHHTEAQRNGNQQ